jgi:hypothetical protein
MKPATILALGLMLSVGGLAQAAVDCGGDGSECETTKYGMGTKPDFRWLNDSQPGRDVESFTTSPADFGPNVGGESYFYSRTQLDNPVGVDCGPERAHFPLVGQILLRERTDCVPTSTGPGEPGVSCRVEIPRTDGGITDPAEASELWIFSLAGGVLSFNGQTWFLSAATGNAWSGTSDENNPACLEENVRLEPSQATRYLLPPTHPDYDGTDTQTYIRWDSDPASRLRLHTDDSGVCCWSSDGGISCNIINPGTPQYPLLLQRSCAESGRFQFDDAVTGDWVFAGGRGSAFYSDPHYIPPGQTKGVCKDNRFQGCVAGDGVCEAMGDTCDLTEPGVRIRPLADSNGNPVGTSCGRSLYVIRGTPNEGCSLLTRYEENGDPGMECSTINYGINHRTDENCDGVADQAEDLCPFLTEWENDADTDGDCPGPNCRGDECECGDQTLDGVTDVDDILGINSAIFAPLTATLRCDTTDDLVCNVEDILGVNQEIFDPGTSSCRAVFDPSP